MAEEPEHGRAGDRAKPDVPHWLLAFLVSQWWSQATDSSICLQQAGTSWLGDPFLDGTMPGDCSTSSSPPEKFEKESSVQARLPWTALKNPDTFFN